jgi:uncharacterized protein (UPF0297 family)
MMKNMDTVKFEVEKDKSQQVHEVLTQVYDALSEKGYDPVSQFVGYFMSGDPTYITSHKNARGIIDRVELDEIMEELIKKYLNIE